MNVPTLTTAQVAEKLGIAPRMVSKTARDRGIGHNFGGRIGFRFTEDDAATILATFRVTAGGAE